jgi:hypothetical protein
MTAMSSDRRYSRCIPTVRDDPLRVLNCCFTLLHFESILNSDTFEDDICLIKIRVIYTARDE